MDHKVNCLDGDINIVDTCEKCGSGPNGNLYCRGDCKWSNGKCVLGGKFLLMQKTIHLIIKGQ